MLAEVNLLSEFFMFLIWVAGMVVFVFIVAIVYITIEAKGGKKGVPDDALDYEYKSDILPEDGYYIDLHSHTLASDGWMTPEQNIRWHIANGFDAFVLTDHNTGKNNKPTLELQEKYPEILIIPGYEWTAMNIHLNFIGIEDYPYKVPSNASDDDVKTAIARAKDLGAVVMVDHITWTKDQPRLRSGDLVHPTREDLLEWGADGFEINNEMYWHDPKTIALHERWGGEWRDRKIFLGTGTDIHNPLTSWVTGWTQLFLDEKDKRKVSIEMVKQALLDGKTKTWQDYDYHKPNEERWMHGSKGNTLKTIFAPFIGVVKGAEYVFTNNKIITSYVIWLMIAYLPIRLLFWIFNLL